MNKNDELPRDDSTQYIYDEVIFGDPVLDPSSPGDLITGINKALELDSAPIFLEGLAKRLCELGTICTKDDKQIMLAEVKRRFKQLLGKDCPKAVTNWIRGTPPGVTNRCNQYDLCYALEMDLIQVRVFFQKYYLTIPFNVKSREDAVYFYCFAHKKPYSTAVKMLSDSSGFVQQENAHTHTSQIKQTILETDDDDKFLGYLSAHCYGNEQQFQLARQIINEDIGYIKKTLCDDPTKDVHKGRENSSVVAELLGYKYQRDKKNEQRRKLPKRFTESLINDVTLGKIINGEKATYETLRKALMLCRFYRFYSEANNIDELTINGNLLDFYDELNNRLIQCGFARLYVRHPFDCLLLYCANSDDPIVAMTTLNEYGNEE